MKQCKLSKEERARRKALSYNTRKMVCGILEIKAQNRSSIATTYEGFFLQITFSDLHPLMAFCLEKPLEETKESATLKSNLANLSSVLGKHCVFENDGRYQYRATHWLDTEITPARFLEILNRFVVEASRGYKKIAS